MARKNPRSTLSSLPIPTKRPSTEVDPVSAFAWDICKGKLPSCRLARLACERHFRDLATGAARGLTWRPDIAIHRIALFRFMRHSKGEWGGHIIILEPWQQFVVGSVFGWKRADGTRRFRSVYEELPRKNGKSTLVAGVGLIGLVADNEPGAEIYAAATRRDQARIVFGEAVSMVRKSPGLRAKIKAFKLNLSVDETGSKFEPLSSDDRTLDGLNPHFVLIDELHKHKSRALLDVLDTALGSRRQPLLWIITTAGDDLPESVYAQENAYAINVLESAVEDDSLFVFITTIDATDRWDDPKAWAKANPNIGISVKLDDLKRQAQKAKNSPSAQEAFKRLRLNVRTAAANRFINMDVWRRNSLGRFDPATLRGRPCYAGLDLSSKLDISAWVKLFPPIAAGERWRLTANFWMPADTIADRADRDRAQYHRWVSEGWIEATPGNVVDHTEIGQVVMEDSRLYDIQAIAYDPWNATQLAVALQGEGLPMFEFVQGLRSYTAPTKELEALLTAARLDHGDNPVLTWMAANLAVQRDKNENLMPTKAHSVGRIDGMTALIMAVGRGMLTTGPAYENRDLVVF
jgi:phage terminase large subunit-like protein